MRKTKEKTKVLWISFAIVLFAASCIIYVPRQEEYPPPERETTREREYRTYRQETDIAYFYEYLSPYGTWVYYSPHGYVWIPQRVSYKWRPYTYGRWVWTRHGWTWISYYDWGWIPFHYGRWGWSAGLGWYWVPGSVWAPAWVTWRWSNLYIGWAPLPPDVEFVAGFGIRSLPYELPHHYWIFIEGRYFQYDYLDRYVLPHERNSTVFRFTVSKANLTVRDRQVMNPGVDIDQVRRVTRSEVSRYELQDSARPGRGRVSGRVVEVYRPQVSKSEAARPRSFLQKEEAEARIPELRLRGLEQPGSAEPPDRWLKQEQEKELRLLEQSQQREEEEFRRKLDAEKKLVSDPAVKEKVDKEHTVKVQELKKQHAEEKAKVAERHQEEEKVVKKKVKKKDERD